MSEPLQDFRPDSDAKQIADALRTGAEARAHLNETRRGEDEARLNALGDLEGLTTVAKPGPAAPLMKAARRLLHALVRPWLSMQTIFNRELARRFEQTTTRTHDLDRRVPRIEEAMQALETRLSDLERTPADHAEPPPPPLVRLDSLFTLFAHSRLPAPPARILVCGPASSMAAALVSFGYDVTALGIAAAGPRIRVVESSASLEPDSCAAAIWHRVDTAQAAPIAPRELARVLAPGGRLFTSLRMAASDGETPAAQLAPLDVVSILLLQQQEDGTYSAVRSPVPDTETVAFVDARRSDVPDR